MKKKVIRHVLFWICYFIENSLFEFTWIRSFFPNNRHGELIIQALCMNLVLIPSKLLFTYFVFNFSIPKAFNKSISNTSNIIITIGLLLASLLIHQFGSVSLLIRNPSFHADVETTYSSIFKISGLFTALLDLGFICGIAIALKLFRMQLQALKKEKDQTRDKLETELKFLKSQLNPHFLFNTLNNIYALARKKSDLAPVIILKLSELLRFMLYETEKSQVSISEEIRVLEDYVEVEKVRFSKRLHISFRKEIDDDSQPITPLILLPFIENAFKHGPGEMLSDAFIDIHILLHDGLLTFTVINSKEEDCTDMTEKIGLSNVRRQLELLYKEFKLNTESLNDAFKLNLSINLNKDAAI